MAEDLNFEDVLKSVKSKTDNEAIDSFEIKHEREFDEESEY